MRVPVILKDGSKHSVHEDTLQFLIATKQVKSFKRSNGWVVVDRDKVRNKLRPYAGKNRRHISWFVKVWA